MKPSFLTKAKNKQVLRCLKDNLECKICFTPMNGEVWQCKEGHIVCSKCKISCEDNCAYCKTPIQSRNRVLEELFSNYTIYCSHENCKYKCFNNEQMQKHKEECIHKPIKCMFCKSFILPDKTSILNHFISHHKSMFATKKEAKGMYKRPNHEIENMKEFIGMNCPIQYRDQESYEITYFSANYMYDCSDDQESDNIYWLPKIIQVEDDNLIFDVRIIRNIIRATLYQLSYPGKDKLKRQFFLTISSKNMINMTKVCRFPTISHDHSKDPIVHMTLDLAHTELIDDKRKFGFKIFAC